MDSDKETGIQQTSPLRDRRQVRDGNGADGEDGQKGKVKWVSESLSLPREALFVTVVCMAQFCTRKLTDCIAPIARRTGN
ncbi:hypothetical protein DCS_06364 [Drechmeria coniospora]|uniref:Uncharacterized protein n=1 Tax=Drechmeria coniospora TaxID=98403 RepID=A0A151GBA7_DRECN|nr:hypothetical protein DCS_06364 [Drechmeria coniospora]KYK54406.1 hypothetical protein DCS_06364 [Drechmeria coniospora]